jgi:hypothetical protein
MKRQILLIACAVILACAPPLRADAVLDWNAISAQVIFAAARPGPSAIIDFAVVAATVHDAVQAYDKKFEPYATEICDATGSPAAAIAKANRDILLNRFPAQAGTINTAYDNYLAANDLEADDPGVAVGAAAAAGMIALRADDGAFPATFPPFVGANIPGLWRPTPSFQPGPPAMPGPPPSFAPMAVPWAAEVTPFVVLSPEQFRCAPPIKLTSSKYTKEFNEVKALGARFNSARTPEQTHVAYLWAGNFLAQVNDVLRALSEEHLDGSADRARLFAITWLTAADAFINTWNNKVFFPTWRPVTAVREADTDGNPKTAPDPLWEPLINTPNYPDHCSGANALLGSTTKAMSLFFRTDHMTFTVTTINPNAVPPQKTYHRFSDAAADVVEARILQGIHFRSADLEGRKLGRQVARWVHKHALRPLRGHKHNCNNHDCDDTDDEDQD